MCRRDSVCYLVNARIKNAYGLLGIGALERRLHVLVPRAMQPLLVACCLLPNYHTYYSGTRLRSHTMTVCRYR